MWQTAEPGGIPSLAPGCERLTILKRPEIGLTAVLVIDDSTLGPAAGGVRSLPYPDLASAIRDAASLARSMTIKCALAGLNAGGGKAVMITSEGLARAEAFRCFGRYVERLGGAFRTAGDAGTTDADLAAMAEGTQWVHRDEGELASAVGETVAKSMRAALAVADGCAYLPTQSLLGLRVALQGCGAIGSAVARVLADAGARLWLADVDDARAHALAERVGGTIVAASEILMLDVDVVAPCAIGGVIRADNLDRVRARVVCGGANLIVDDLASERALNARGILVVPDPLSSAGAVIEGIGRSVMGLGAPARRPLLEGIGPTTYDVMFEAKALRKPASEVARARAYARIAAARAAR